MLTIAIWMSVAALGWVIAFGVFWYALRERWFGRYEHGFYMTVLLALAGVALMMATVVGIWGYLAAKRILDQELVVELQDVGGIVEGQISSQIQDVETQLKGLGESVAAAIAKHAPASDLNERLTAAQSFNNRFLQLRLVDPDGKLIVETSVSAGLEPINRVAVAFNLDGKPYVSDAYLSPTFKRQMLHISIPIRDAVGQIRVLISARFDLQAELGSLIGNTKFNQSGYAVVVDGEGQIIAHPNPKRLDDDVSSYPAVKMARQSGGVGEVMALNAEGRRKLFVYRAMRNPGTLAKEPWVLLTEIDLDEELASLRQLRSELLIGITILVAGTLLIASQISTSIRRPLEKVRECARRIGTGDLTEHLDITGKDIAGSLAGTLNDMIAGLKERDHVKDVFGRYIATQVSDKILKGEVNLGGEAKMTSILFSDIRNFTGMSEQMTPQQVVTFLNDYFTEMVDAVFEGGGVLDKFIGDGLMAVFGSIGDQPDHAKRAVTTALRMKALLAKINGERAMKGKAAIAIGVGIHTDEVVVGNIGSRKRLEYTVVGDGVNAASRLQGLNKEFGTTILISETTYEAVKDDFETRLMPEAQLRGKTKELKFYEVVSVKAGVTA